MLNDGLSVVEVEVATVLIWAWGLSALGGATGLGCFRIEKKIKIKKGGDLDGFLPFCFLAFADRSWVSAGLACGRWPGLFNFRLDGSHHHFLFCVYHSTASNYLASLLPYSGRSN